MAEFPSVSAPSGLRVQGAAGSLATPQATASQLKAASALGADGIQLSSDAQRILAQLKATDAKVRAHEAAHVAAGAGVVRGGASFSYTRGPDGKQYAVAGEVAIDTGGVPGDPKATLAKAEQIQAAALAPVDPSAQDRAVAAAAASLAAQAQIELSQQAGVPGRGGSEGAKGLQFDFMA